MSLFLIALGGALGSLARHGLNHVVRTMSIGGTFPIGIFLVNILGSVAIGAFAGVIAGGRVHVSHDLRLFVVVGLLGGFTTFSSFSLDTFALMRDGHMMQAAANVVGQVTLSLIGVWAGFRLVS